MRLPRIPGWPRRETRAASYTSAVSAALIAAAAGKAAVSEKHAAREIAAGLWARAFAGAHVTPENALQTAALTPALLAAIGRSIISDGECVLLIEITSLPGSEVQLIPASSWEIAGGPIPALWIYTLTMAGPSFDTTRKVAADRVIHCQYSADSARPWVGLGPLEHASETNRLAGALETALADEAKTPRGQVIVTPADDDSDELQTDLRGLAGNLALVPSTRANWDNDTTAGPRSEYKPQRLGADPPPVLETLRGSAAASILAACGIPTALSLSRSDGTALREAWRQFVLQSVKPVAAIVIAEMRSKLDLPDLDLDFAGLGASDATGRARAISSRASAVQRLTAAGMPLAEAVDLVGLRNATD